MIQEHVLGDVVGIDQDGTMTIKAGAPSIERALLRKYRKCEIILEDGRRISPQRRRAIYAHIGEVDEFVNGIRTTEGMEEQKQFFKMEFMLKRMQGAERDMFSLSDCSMTTAREFQSSIIDFIVRNGIPTKISLLEHCDDIARYIYACTVNKRCCVCGQPCDLHHVEGDRVGMGSDRKDVHHLGRKCLPLCRTHHTECHNGEADFTAKYHLEPVKIDGKICKIYGLKK